MELYRRTDEILHYIWDPIGIAGAAGARDEYLRYLPDVFRLLREDAGAAAIAEYLDEVVRDRIGIAVDPRRADEVAQMLVEAKEWIAEFRGDG